MDKTSEAMRTTPKERGRLASQRHREIQKKRGIPDARQIDEVLLAYLTARIFGKGLHVTAQYRDRLIDVVVQVGGWKGDTAAIGEAVRRRLEAHQTRFKALKAQSEAKPDTCADSAQLTVAV